MTQATTRSPITRQWTAGPRGDERAGLPMASRRGSRRGEALRWLGALAVTLALAVLVAEPAAAAKDTEMQANSQSAADVCTFTGGTAIMDYDYNVDGSVSSIQTTCDGGQADGQVCTATPSSFECTFPFTQPPKTPVQSTRPGAGVVGGVVDTPGQVAPALGAAGANQRAVKAHENEPSKAEAKHAKDKGKNKSKHGGKGRKK